MICHIDPTNGIPIYEQIVRHVIFAVANRSLLVGEHVPSVRELAAQVAVNPNTVSRAYRELQTDGVLTPIRGTGLAVAADAQQLCGVQRQEMIRSRIRSVLAEALRSGIDADAIRTVIEQELTGLAQEAANASPDTPADSS